MPTANGLRAIQTLISTPMQWHILLALTTGPRRTGQLWRTLAGGKGCLLWDLGRLRGGHLVVFHPQTRTWRLSPLGESLRPILRALEQC